jgi:hypothetical protein
MEHGGAVKKWNHVILVELAGAGRTRYTDSVDIEAGLLSPAIWLYAQFFYRYRHWRWRKLARTL